MIRYKRLFESESDYFQVGDVVDYAGHEWIVIKVKYPDVTLLAKNSDFGRYPFDLKGRDYASSQIWNYLKDKDWWSDLKPNGAEPEVVRLEDDSSSFVYLLSEEEARRLPQKAIEFSDTWWLRSPGDIKKRCNVCLQQGQCITH